MRLVVNADDFGLTEGQRKALQAFAGEGLDSLARDAAPEFADRSSFEDLQKRGVEAVTLSTEEKRAFAAATKPVYDKWAGTVGTDLVRKAEAAVRAVSA